MLELIGYGARIVLNHPLQLARLAPEQAPAPDTVIMARPGGDGRKVLVAPGDTSQSGAFTRTELEEHGMQGWVLQQNDDGVRVVLGEDKELGDMAEVAEGPKARQWELQSSKGYAGKWPEGYNLLTTDETTTWPFEMLGHDGSMLYVRGPMPKDRVPSPTDLAVGDQTLEQDRTDADQPWVELSFDHDGTEYRLSYHFVEFGEATIAVCAQAPAASAQKAQERARDFAASLRMTS